MEGPITEKALRCLSADRARGTRAYHEPKNEGLGEKLDLKPAYRDQSSTMVHIAQPVTNRQTSAEILYKMRPGTKRPYTIIVIDLLIVIIIQGTVIESGEIV